MNTTTPASEAPRAPITAMWITLVAAWVLFLIPIPGTGLFVGWPLNLVAFIIAIVVMTRGRTAQGLIGLISSLVVSPIIYFGSFVLMAALLGSGSYDDYKRFADEAATATEAGTFDQASLDAMVAELEAAASDLEAEAAESVEAAEADAAHAMEASDDAAAAADRAAAEAAN